MTTVEAARRMSLSQAKNSLDTDSLVDLGPTGTLVQPAFRIRQQDQVSSPGERKSPLEKLVADLSLDNQVLKEVVAKKW